MGLNFSWSAPKHDIRAIIFYPNRQMSMKRVKVTEDKFVHEGRNFLIDEKSIYFMDKQPVAIYHFKDSSPKMVRPEGITDSMNSQEVSAVMESKVVQDIITASKPDLDITLILVAITCVIAIMGLLIDFGVINIG